MVEDDQEDTPNELAQRVTSYKPDTRPHFPCAGSLSCLQHLLDNEGNRHAGETAVALVIALLVFVACWFGARLQTKH